MRLTVNLLNPPEADLPETTEMVDEVVLEVDVDEVRVEVMPEDEVLLEVDSPTDPTTPVPPSTLPTKRLSLPSVLKRPPIYLLPQLSRWKKGIAKPIGRNAE